MELIAVENLKKNFGTVKVLKGVSFKINKGDVAAIIGPSGSGKSTLLRCLIDLEQVNDGTITIDGRHLCENGKYAYPAEKKQICGKMGMVFQHFNLFPHMTVRKNLLCAPTLRKMGKAHELNALCEKVLKKVGLIDKIDQSPSSLSGGQKQRVAIARALMLNPDIMLFDEPTSALDPELTNEVLTVIKELALENITMIIVTHEIGFAKEAANNIFFMDNGTILDSGSPDKIIDNTNNERIKSFLNTVL